MLLNGELYFGDDPEPFTAQFELSFPPGPKETIDLLNTIVMPGMSMEVSYISPYLLDLMEVPAESWIAVYANFESIGDELVEPICAFTSRN